MCVCVCVCARVCVCVCVASVLIGKNCRGLIAFELCACFCKYVYYVWVCVCGVCAVCVCVIDTALMTVAVALFHKPGCFPLPLLNTALI